MDGLGSILARSSAVTYAEIVYPPGSTYGPVVQPSIEVGLVYRGTMTAWVEGECTDVQAGNACLLLPGRHSHYVFSTTTETDHSWVHLWSTRGYPPTMINRLSLLPTTIPLSRPLARQMRDLLDLRSSRLPNRTEIEALTAHLILFRYVGEAELSRRVTARSAQPVEKALDHIENNLAAPLDLEALATAAAVSTSHLFRLFHDQLGTTPSRYLWGRRVDQGIALLEETGLSVTEIARRCGFRTSHHFSRRVHATTGLAPSLVRDRAQVRGQPAGSVAPPPADGKSASGRDQPYGRG